MWATWAIPASCNAVFAPVIAFGLPTVVSITNGRRRLGASANADKDCPPI